MNISTIGVLCISSVCYKESGFMDYRFTACKAARELGFKVIRNPEDTGITQNSFNSVLKQNNPVFILIVGSSTLKKSEKVIEECKLALENGLPIFAFIKTASDKKIPENAEEVIKSISKTTFDGDCTLFSSCEELYYTLQARLQDYIRVKISLYPNIQDNSGSTYYYAYEQILRAKKRIILSQKTSLLILGPRKGNKYERRAYDALVDWIKNKDKDMQFMHLFCKEKTVKAMSSGEYNIETAKSTLFQLLENELKKDKRLHSFSGNLPPLCRNASYLHKISNGCSNSEPHNFVFRSIEEETESVAHLITDTGVQFVLPIAGNTFNLVLPYYFTTESELMKLITHLYSQEYMTYENIRKLYETSQLM